MQPATTEGWRRRDNARARAVRGVWCRRVHRIGRGSGASGARIRGRVRVRQAVLGLTTATERTKATSRAKGRGRGGCPAAVVLTQDRRKADRRRGGRRRAREVAEGVLGVVDAGLVSAVGFQLRRGGVVGVPLLRVLLLCYPGAGASMLDSSVWNSSGYVVVGALAVALSG